MLLDLIILPPLLVLGITTPWWLRGVFRWWLGLVCPGWSDDVHGRSRRPSQLRMVRGGGADAVLEPPRQVNQPRHLRLVRGGGHALDPVA